MELTIRQRRVGVGKKQAELAAEAGVSQNSVSWAERIPGKVPGAERKILAALDRLEMTTAVPKDGRSNGNNC